MVKPELVVSDQPIGPVLCHCHRIRTGPDLASFSVVETIKHAKSEILGNLI